MRDASEGGGCSASAWVALVVSVLEAWPLVEYLALLNNIKFLTNKRAQRGNFFNVSLIRLNELLNEFHNEFLIECLIEFLNELANELANELRKMFIPSLQIEQ